MAPKKKLRCGPGPAKAIASGDKSQAVAKGVDSICPLMRAVNACIDSMYSLRHKTAGHVPAGWVCFSFAEIREVLMHFTLTNFVALPGLLGRELRGAPMGDALSGAVLRLFKWRREAAQLPVEEVDTVCFRRSCSKLVPVCGCNMLVLDVNFRDDLRMFCVWDGQAIIDKEKGGAMGYLQAARPIPLRHHELGRV